MIKRAVILLLLSSLPAWATPARTILPGTMRPEVARATDLGPVAGSLRLDHVLLLLRRPAAREAAAAAFTTAQANPASPEFHHWLTPAEIGERFGALPSDVRAVTTWLESEGLHVNRVLAGGMVIDISGPAAAVGHAFGTSIHHITVDGAAHMANISNVSIPTALAPMLAGPVSLHDFRPHNHHRRGPAASGPRAHAMPRLSNGATGELVTPADLAKIYDFNPLFDMGLSGAGQTVTVVEDSDLYATSDWTIFRSVFGLKRFSHGSLSVQHPNCGDPGVNSNGDDVEATLDVEWASAAAPNAAIVLASCAATSTSDGVTLAMTNLINGTAGTKIISVSYGNCETQNSPPGNQYYATLFQTAVLQGISVFVATGDTGASDCAGFVTGTKYGIGVDGWASTPYDIAMGGTDFADAYLRETSTYWGGNGIGLANAKSYIPEQAWNDTCAGALLRATEGYATSYGISGFCNVTAGKPFQTLGGGEGGPSACATGTAPSTGIVGGTCAGWPKPSWQTGVVGIPADGVRDIPDVSLFASDGTVWNRQYALCFSDPNNQGAACTGTTPAEVAAWAPGGGGTSYATPIMAGLQALINQRTGSAWGNSNTVLYPLASREYGRSGSAVCNSSLGTSQRVTCIFHDVTRGDNVQDCTRGSADCFGAAGNLGVLSTSVSVYQPSYQTGVGYDFPTGLGSVDARNLVLAWPHGG